ncbi:hypothetical protein FJU30_23840 [Affinibrenneria salicis]|uniref:Uncharacterized protein n=1 Tax=Affinibrenneria salicis TaxID=2590031 RepID=A0A5J5FRV8_9GAMM|nr:hypothetical protein [Affinibrenneria salicis]KAA8995599.1 hypothetical protein FJU30_23840 [Affinibrenneria salicis]
MLSFIGQLIVLIIVIAAMLFIFGLYVRGLTALSKKAIQRQLASGKMTDQQLTKFYHIYKKRKDQHLMPILMHGIFYKSFVRMQRDIYQIYRDEMEKRQLPL